MELEGDGARESRVARSDVGKVRRRRARRVVARRQRHRESRDDGDPRRRRLVVVSRGRVRVRIFRRRVFRRVVPRLDAERGAKVCFVLLDSPPRLLPSLEHPRVPLVRRRALLARLVRSVQRARVPSVVRVEQLVDLVHLAVRQRLLRLGPRIVDLVQADARDGPGVVEVSLAVPARPRVFRAPFPVGPRAENRRPALVRARPGFELLPDVVPPLVCEDGGEVGQVVQG